MKKHDSWSIFFIVRYLTTNNIFEPQFKKINYEKIELIEVFNLALSIVYVNPFPNDECVKVETTRENTFPTLQRTPGACT